MSDNRYSQIKNGNTGVHFSKAMFGEVESSRMTATPVHITTFNAGQLVPIYCREILPDESIDMSLDYVIRQSTLLKPTMGSMHVDFYAFFVPNRIVNQSWKAVEGENYNGSWTANPVSLAPLKVSSTGSTSIPVGSVADYYGFPTQQAIPNSVLSLCHDLKFRGYVMIWNEWFRDQNYQPPIPLSTLNVYQGFMDLASDSVPLDGVNNPLSLAGSVSDGAFGKNSINESIYGSFNGSGACQIYSADASENPYVRFRATSSPLLVNKFHDYFTSVLPSPQKGGSVFAPVSGDISVPISPQFVVPTSASLTGTYPALMFRSSIDGSVPSGSRSASFVPSTGSGTELLAGSPGSGSSSGDPIYPSNLQTVGGNLSGAVSGLELSVDDIRMASAIQQVYETLARGGSRYREIISSFFGIEVDNPFTDVPVCLGHISRDLDLFQTAQTSSSDITGSSTPQGNLAGFGYTSDSGHFFSHRFVEHGYLHIFAVVRHRNIYSSMLGRDNFRLNMLDFYLPSLANISEQPVYTREINPFSPNPNGGFGYQEAWAEYRYEPDQVSGLMRPGVDGNISLWNYADDFNSSLQIATGDWIKSNSQSVLDRTLAVTSSVAPQFLGQFKFIVDKTLPMPTYSVPGMDII